MKITLSPQLLTSAHKTIRLIENGRSTTTDLPQYDIDGEPITTVKSLASAMGVDKRVAALYALDRQRKDMFGEAIAELSEPFGRKHLSVTQYAEEIAGIDVSKKTVRLVRTVLGARRFSQPRGSIIVTDGDAPLNNIRVMPNDVRGYDKITDSKGRIFYIGEEANRWVVRAPGQHQPLFVGDSDKDAYYWLDSAVVGKKPKVKK